MEENTLFYMKAALNLRKIILLIKFFAIDFFRTIGTYQFLKNDWIFINHGLFFKQNIIYKCDI